MKKVLQKTLFRRLHTLLLLAVMFVVGGSAAWAETVTVTFVGNTKTVEVSSSSLLSASIDGDASATGGVMGLGAGATFTVSAGTGKKITRISFGGTTGNLNKMTSDSPEYSNSTWNGEATSVTFTSTATFVDVIMGSGPKFSKVEVNVESAVAAPIDYHLEIVNAPDANAKATLDGEEFGTTGGTRSVAKNLTSDDVTNVTEYANYYYDITYTEGNHTFTVTYYAYTKYSVVLSGESEYTGGEAGVVVSGATYGNGSYGVGTDVIKSKGALTQSNFAAKEVQLYDGVATLNGNTVTVSYTRKVMPPFSITQFNPAPSASVNQIQNIMLYVPAGKTFVREDVGRQVDLTFESTSGVQTVKAQYACTNDYYATLTILQKYGDNYYTGSFSTPGTWGVAIPAGVVTATDGSLSNEIRISYTIVTPAAMTSATPANNSSITNNDLIGRNFTMTFDKNIASVDPYLTLVRFPDGTDTYLNSLNQYGSALSVSVLNNTVTFTPNQYFWTWNASHLRSNGTLRFSIDRDGLTDANGVKNVMPAQAYYNYTYVAPTSAVTAPAENVEVSLDDQPYGFNYLELTFDKNFLNNVSYAADDALPAGFNLTLPTGVTRGNITATANDNKLRINLDGGNVAGNYRVQINQGVLAFVDATFGEGVNAVVDKTWTLTPATKFAVSSWENISSKTADNELTAGGSLKSLKSFTVSAPQGKTFANVESPVTVTVNEKEVSTSVVLVEGVVTFTFTEAYTEEGSVRVSVPEGVITTSDNLTSKAFTANFTIQPYDYFSISAEPAPETTYTGDRNTIVITLPVGKTAATVGSTISLNGNSETVTNYAIDGNTVTLTLENGFQYGSNYYSIPADFLTDTNGDKNSSFGSWSVNVVKHMMYASANVNGQNTTTNSVTVEKFSNVEIYFDEPFDGYVGSIPAGMTLNNGAENVAITGGWTQKQTWEDAYNDYKYHSFYFYFNEISAPGTYTVNIPAGVFTSAEGNTNEEVNLDIVIPTPEYFAAMTVSPATGTTMESLRTITLTAPDGVTFDDVKGLQGYPTINESRDYMYGGYEFADDKKSVTININERTTDGAYTVTFPEGFVRSTDGKWSHELTATYTVSYPWFTLRSNNVTPATGELAAIENITIAAPAGIEFATPAANVTIVVNGVDTQVGASLNGEGRIVLAYSATKADRYEISIPAKTFTASDGFKKNLELTGLTYTIQPSLAINEHSMDDKGDTWTTFCLNKDFTLEDGYTPYIVRDNGEGGIKLVELLGTPKYGEAVYAHFNQNGAAGVDVVSGYQSGSFTTSDGNYEVQITKDESSSWTSTDGGHYLWCNGTNEFVITVKNSAAVPAKIELVGWNHGYADNVQFTMVDDVTFSFIVGGSNYVGGIAIYPATGEYNTPIVPANTGILVKGAAKSGIKYTPASGTRADVSGNLLWGCTQSQTKEVSDDQYIYKLAWASSAYDNFGFYWGSNNGHSIQANAGKAYLILDADQSAGSNRMMIFGGNEGTPTAIDAVESVVDDAPIFNLQGKRVSSENLPAGVYVKNGRKFIVK